MTNPADQYIVEIIKDLSRKATRLGVTNEDRQVLINQIAELRASMNPTIIQDVKKD